MSDAVIVLNGAPVPVIISGNPGPVGKGAYETALANGFVGSISDWLLSLRAEPVRQPPLGFPANNIPFDFQAWEIGNSGVFGTNQSYTKLTPGDVALTLYVDGVAGNDANLGTNPASPKKTLKSAELKAWTDDPASVLILAKGGFYNQGEGYDGQGFTRGNCKLVGLSSWDGAIVYSTSRYVAPVWTSIGSGAFSTPLTSAYGFVRVWQGPDVENLAIYALQTSSANVQANASSYYHDGTTLFVKTAGGTAPDSTVWVLDGAPSASTGGPGMAYHVDNITYVGNGGCGFSNTIYDLADPNINVRGTAFAYKIRHLYCSIGDAFGSYGAYDCVFFECETRDSEADGFTYGEYVASGPSPRVIEINPRARRNGRNGTLANQNSTAHGNSLIITVNPNYADAQDRCVHDVGTCNRWILGGTIAPPQRTGAMNTPLYAGINANIWVDKTTLIGNTYAIATDVGATVHKSNATITGTVAGNVLDYVSVNVAGLSADVLATVAQYRSNSTQKIVTTNVAWSAAEPVALIPGANVIANLSGGINFTLAMGGNYTLANPAGAKPGQSGFVKIVQDATGNRTLAYGSTWKFAGGTAPVLSTVAGAVDVLFYQALSASLIVANLVKAVG